MDDNSRDTIPGLLAQAAQLHGAAPAVQWLDGGRSFHDLDNECARFAKGLVNAGVGKGSRVAILSGNSWFMVLALFACTRVGAIAIPISTLATPSELAHIVRHCDAQVLLAKRHYLGRDYGKIIAQALPELADEASGGALRLRAAPFLRSIWLDDPQGLAWARSTSDLVAAGERDPSLDARFLEAIQAEVSPADAAVIIYTSGSTALPKAVVHAHGPVVRQARALARSQIAFPGERVLCVMPLFWVGGMNLLLEAIAVGSCFLISEDVSPQAIATAIRELKADAFIGWPPQRSKVRNAMIDLGLDYTMVRGLREERRDDGSLRPIEELPNVLGMTETFGPHGIFPFGVALPPGRSGAFAPESNGFERRVVDPATREVVAVGHIGELEVRGGSMMKGYYKVERARSFTPDGYFATGDIVHIDSEGYLYFHGRNGDTIKTNGANVSRLEVERALCNIPGVQAAVVCGLPDPERGQIVVAAVVLKDGEVQSEDGLKSVLRQSLSGYKVPGHILFISDDDLPWTGTGKIRLAEIASLVEQRLKRTPTMS